MPTFSYSPGRLESALAEPMILPVINRWVPQVSFLRPGIRATDSDGSTNFSFVIQEDL